MQSSCDGIENWEEGLIDVEFVAVTKYSKHSIAAAAKERGGVEGPSNNVIDNFLHSKKWEEGEGGQECP